MTYLHLLKYKKVQNKLVCFKTRTLHKAAQTSQAYEIGTHKTWWLKRSKLAIIIEVKVTITIISFKMTWHKSQDAMLLFTKEKFLCFHYPPHINQLDTRLCNSGYITPCCHFIRASGVTTTMLMSNPHLQPVLQFQSPYKHTFWQFDRQNGHNYFLLIFNT